MERKQDHSSCPDDIGACHRRRTISNSERRGECQSAPESLESAPYFLRRDGSRSSDSSVSSDDQNVRPFILSPTSPIPQEAAHSEEYSQAKTKTIPSEESWKSSCGTESTSTPSSSRVHEAVSTEEARQEDPAALSLQQRGVQESGRESKSSAPRSRRRKRTGGLATSRRKPTTISLEPARQAVATASGRYTTTEKDDPELGQTKWNYASLSQARELAKSREDLSIPSDSVGHTGTEGGKLITTATHKTTGGTSVAAQREYPRTDSAHIPSRDLRERERVQSGGDINIGASTSQGFVEIQHRKRSVTAIHHIPAGTSMAAQLSGPRYYAPRPRPLSQVQGHLSSREDFKDASTSTGRAVIQGRERSTSESHEATIGTIVAAGQNDNPLEEHYAHGRRLESGAQDPPESENDDTAFASMEHAGTGRCERSSTVPHDTAAEGFVAANLKDARQQHGAPGRRQRSQAEEFAESEVTRTTSHGNVGIQGEEHNPVASTSHADILPRDSQGPIPAKGEPDNYSASEQSSSGDESSGVASSGGTEAASAFPSVPRRPAFVRALSRLSTTSRRPRMKAAVGETEEVAGRAQSGPVDPVEGTSSGPMSEPTHPERHSYTPLDHPHDLSARVNDAMVEMVTQRITEVQRLRTEMQQLGMRARESTRLMRQRLQEHADFIHGLREKVEEEETENEEMKEPKKIKKEKTKKEYIPVASTSSDDLVPGDSQEKSLIERHRRAKGDSDKHSTPEQISSGDESSGVAPSGATGAASAYPSMLHGNASVQGSVPLSMEGRRPRMKAVAGKVEEVAGRAQSAAIDPIEGTSSGTLSEPTQPERHSYEPLDHPHGLSAPINDALVERVRQMNIEAQLLCAEMQQLRERIVEHARLMIERLQKHVDFIHGLREKMEKENAELEKMEKKKPKKPKKKRKDKR